MAPYCFSRRSGVRFNRGRTSRQSGGGTTPPAPPSSVLDAITSVAFNFYIDTTTGVVEGGGAGTGVTAWNDQSGAGVNFTGAGGPTFHASGGPNDAPYIQLDGTDDALSSAWVPAAPGTRPVLYEFIVRANTPANGDVIGAGSTTGAATRQALIWQTTGPQLRASAGVNIAVAAANNTWARVRAYFSNSTSDFVQFAANISTGVSAGNNPGTGGGTGGYTLSGNFGAFSYVAAYSTAGLPTQDELDAVDAIWAARYGL